ncbi:MAG: hypothetical protein HY263_03500 [Chloroflexi bacterium]|nr:hypothetical protein [Chloroflexota bacterium]
MPQRPANRASRSRRDSRGRRTDSSANARRSPAMRIRLRDVLAIGAVVILALGLLVGGCTVLGQGPRTTPAPSGPVALAPGTYRSLVFQPPVSVTLPAGWWISIDSADYFAVQPVVTDQAGIHIFSGPLPASQAATCPEAPEPRVGTLDLQLATWIRSRPGFVTSQPRPVTLGGRRGVEIDVSIAESWKQSCPFANGLPAVPLFVGANASYRWVVAGTERLRLDLLAVDGRTVVVDVDAFDGSLMDTLVPQAQPIVQSLTFVLPSPSP